MNKLLRGIAKATGYLVLLAFLGVCGFLNFANAPDKAERDRKARADAVELIAALEDFRSEESGYPTALQELVPRWVAEVPARAGGGPFRYEQHTEGRGFRLGYFDAPMGTLPNDAYHSYDSTSKQWTFELL